MAYKLYDKKGTLISQFNLQEKDIWCREGEKIENEFVRLHGRALGVCINPEKKDNPYAPDLLMERDGGLGDLKTQNTPFFKAKQLYGIDPTFAVVFNIKDAIRYDKEYPGITIYFWVDWQIVCFEQRGLRIFVEPIYGIWKIAYQNLSNLLIESPSHDYLQRRKDVKGNAKSSYVLDIRDTRFVRCL